jgi:transcriptional regulator with XRE-family HTH domain
MPAASDPAIQRQRVIFGQVVRARRLSLGMSQEDLATRAKWSRQSIVRIETAVHSPHLDRVFVLADILGVSVAELFADVDRVGTDMRGPDAVARPTRSHRRERSHQGT